MNTPSELLYTKSHEWVQMLDENTARVGLTDFAQHQLGDLVFVNLPQVGDEAVASETIADVESVKAVSDIYSPASGSISEVNDDVMDNPALINEDPYGAWLFVVSNITDKEELLSAKEYTQVCEEEA